MKKVNNQIEKNVFKFSESQLFSCHPKVLLLQASLLDCMRRVPCSIFNLAPEICLHFQKTTSTMQSNVSVSLCFPLPLRSELLRETVVSGQIPRSVLSHHLTGWLGGFFMAYYYLLGFWDNRFSWLLFPSLANLSPSPLPPAPSLPHHYMLAHLSVRSLGSLPYFVHA